MLETGNVVRVVKRVPLCEYWVPEMDTLVGLTGVVGLSLSHGAEVIASGRRIGYIFPNESPQLVRRFR